MILPLIVIGPLFVDGLGTGDGRGCVEGGAGDGCGVGAGGFCPGCWPSTHPVVTKNSKHASRRFRVISSPQHERGITNLRQRETHSAGAILSPRRRQIQVRNGNLCGTLLVKNPERLSDDGVVLNLDPMPIAEYKNGRSRRRFHRRRRWRLALGLLLS